MTHRCFLARVFWRQHAYNNIVVFLIPLLQNTSKMTDVNHEKLFADSN